MTDTDSRGERGRDTPPLSIRGPVEPNGTGQSYAKKQYGAYNTDAEADSVCPESYLLMVSSRVSEIKRRTYSMFYALLSLQPVAGSSVVTLIVRGAFCLLHTSSAS